MPKIILPKPIVQWWWKVVETVRCRVEKHQLWITTSYHLRKVLPIFPTLAAPLAPLFRQRWTKLLRLVFPPTTCGGNAAMAFLSTKLQIQIPTALSTSLRGSRESCLVSLVVRNPWIERATFNRAFWFQVTVHPHNHRDEVGVQETRSPQQVPYWLTSITSQTHM